MPSNILVVGGNGGMGKRYRAILNYLGVNHESIDIGDLATKPFDGVIIATPTSAHNSHIKHYSKFGAPILCEKPISKSLTDLEKTLTNCNVPLQMVSQYDHLVDDKSEGITSYDYFKSGADGLTWDVINIVYHARGAVWIDNKSPIWSCVINGKTLNIREMDQAYVEMIDQWCQSPRDDKERIYKAHEKVHDLCNRLTSSSQSRPDLVQPASRTNPAP